MLSRREEVRERAVGREEVDWFMLDVAKMEVNTTEQDHDNEGLIVMLGYDRILEPLHTH